MKKFGFGDLRAEAGGRPLHEAVLDYEVEQNGGTRAGELARTMQAVEWIREEIECGMTQEKSLLFLVGDEATEYQ